MSSREQETPVARPLRHYLLTFDDSFGGREKLQVFLTLHPEYVKNWISQFDHAVMLVSDRSGRELAAWLHANYPVGNFFITQVSNFSGWMHPNVWVFLSAALPAPTPQQSPEPSEGIPVPDQAGDPSKRSPDS